VSGFLDAGILTAAQGRQLIDAAEAIMAALGG
jgi:hypothetical protein